MARLPMLQNEIESEFMSFWRLIAFNPIESHQAARNAVAQFSGPTPAHTGGMLKN